VPSAQRVRFVSSGTEASLLAIRLVRAFTGKNKIVKFEGHFHGWHDQVVPGVSPPWDVLPSVGLLQASIDSTVVLPANDVAAVERALAEDGDIAAVILEPSGASYGTIPIVPGFLAALRRLTKELDTLLVFDEVVTGFRYSPGGVQALEGVVPDVTILAKILAGGLPGGAVVGRADIMEPLEFKADATWNRRRRVYHPGTFNANPLSAAAGVAALRIVATGEPHRLANAAATELRQRMNEAIDERRGEACVYGDASILHVYVGPCDKRGNCDRSLCTNDPALLKGMPRAVAGGLRRSLLINGCDFIGAAALVSSAHAAREVDETAAAFARALDLMMEDDLLKRSTS
jgi:glutamate-1-semialdehyde 2,1-aminomutase